MFTAIGKFFDMISIFIDGLTDGVTAFSNVCKVGRVMSDALVDDQVYEQQQKIEARRAARTSTKAIKA